LTKVLSVVIDNHIGGIQNRLLGLGNGLNELGVQYLFLAPYGEGDFTNIAKKSGFKVYQASIHTPKQFNSLNNIFNNFLWIIKFPLGIMETIKIIYREDIDIVHVNGLLALHAALAAKITRTPLVWHLISTIYPSYLVKILRPFYRRCSDRIVFVAYNTIEYYLNNNKYNNIKVIYEPVDLNFFNRDLISKFIQDEEKHKLDLNENINIIGFVGNINPQKGLENFVDVAYKLLNINKKLKFVIVGNASKENSKYLTKIKDKIHFLEMDDDIIFTGKVTDLRKILSIMDIFLMTSISEGTPVVILEAMAMEIPVIAPNVGGISEQILDGKTGFVIPPSNNDATLMALQVLLSNTELRDEMGKAGRERAGALFSLQKCIKSHYDLYSHLVKRE